MSVDELKKGLKEKEKELNRLLIEICLRIEQKELLARLKREQTLGIAKIEMDIQELGPGNQIGETLKVLLQL